MTIENEPAANSDTTLDEEMRAFDQLPGAIRVAMSDAPFNFCSVNTLYWFDRVKEVHGRYEAISYVLDWHDRRVAEVRDKEIEEGRLLPSA